MVSITSTGRGSDEMTRRLSAGIADRIRSAGVRIIESRLTRLTLRPVDRPGHAAQAAGKCRDRRADADLQGAVGMARLALQRLAGGSLYLYR
jgi:hypothetical protein